MPLSGISRPVHHTPPREKIKMTGNGKGGPRASRIPPYVLYSCAGRPTMARMPARHVPWRIVCREFNRAVRRELGSPAHRTTQLEGFPCEDDQPEERVEALRIARTAFEGGPSLIGLDLIAWNEADMTFEYVRKALPKPTYRMADKDVEGWYSDGDYEARGGILIQMGPVEYIGRVRTLDIDETSRDAIDDLKRHILDGRTLDPLKIYPDGSEDGRHRAHAARELGIDLIPVIVWNIDASHGIMQSASDGG